MLLEFCVPFWVAILAFCVGVCIGSVAIALLVIANEN